MDVEQLQESIRNFTLDDGPRGHQGYSRVLLQIFGYLGHGKSSFINSCKYVLDDGEDFRAYAKAADTDEPMTMERQACDLTKNITMVDNRGSLTMNIFQRAEIYAQLGNFLPIGEKVEWMKDYKDMMTRLEDAEGNPNFSDFIVPILIFSAVTIPNDDDHKAVKEFMTNCMKMTGLFPIVVITKKTSGNFMEIEKMFKLKGAENIISIENYTEKDHIKTRGKTSDILKVIHSALEDVKYRLRQERNPQKDWRQRKKFMLEYIHKADLEMKEEERNKKEAMRRAEEKKREEATRRAEEKKREEATRRAEKRPEANPTTQENSCIIM
ncbi:reticulocyte-binding protein homolog 2b-like [Ranitomeya imitator]|uniref:reticulocyte-binding protein homolog 2b-like n=1 Tax=Ranitomeya imitator TaxID=111125 RepID=UPI0037E766E1